MNLFQFVDDFFKGIVFFIYNVCFTSITLLGRPLRGPVKLFRAYRGKNSRQISSYSALLLATLGFIWILSLREDLFAPITLPTLPTSPELPKAATLWPHLAAAGFIAIAIDALLRLLLRIRFPKNRPRRQVLLGIVEYAMAGPWLALLVVLILYTASYESGDWPPWLVTSAVYVLFVALLIAVLFYGIAAPALLLARGLYGRRLSLRAGLRRTAISLGLVILCVGAVPAGLFAIVSGGWQLYMNIAKSRAEEAAHPQVSIAGLQCVLLADGRLAVEVGFSNANDRAVSFNASDVDIVLGIYGTMTEHNTFAYRDDRARFLAGDSGDLVVIKPNDVALLKGSVAGPGSDDSQYLCSARLMDSAVRVKGAYFPSTGASKLTYVEVRRPSPAVRIGQSCDGEMGLGVRQGAPDMPLLKGHGCRE